MPSNTKKKTKGRSIQRRKVAQPPTKPRREQTLPATTSDLPSDPVQAELVKMYRRGQSALALLPAMSLPEPFADFFTGETMAVREQLVREHGNDPVTTMQADTAATAFFHTRMCARTLSALLADGCQKGALEQAEVIDKMLDRAHRRMLSALDALGRGRGGPVTMKFEQEVSNVCLGDQMVQGGDEDR